LDFAEGLLVLKIIRQDVAKMRFGVGFFIGLGI
jgi:hypothetical protein